MSPIRWRATSRFQRNGKPPGATVSRCQGSGGRKSPPSSQKKGGPRADRVVPPPGNFEPLYIGSWNIKWFGQKATSAYDFVTMADFIEECDFVAIQELRGANRNAVMQALITELNNRGHSYQFRMSAETGYRNNSNSQKRNYTEHYAFMWDTNRVRLKGTPGLLSRRRINNATFRQVPYVADFKVRGANGFDFRVLTTHTVFKRELNAVRKAEI